jgi:4-amino-4-deoxy-L-arabinose transferase-like glycosyltransferase
LAHRRKRAKSPKAHASKQERPAQSSPATSPAPPEQGARGDTAALRATFRARIAVSLAVVALLALHYFLAAQSLMQENPTVDEVVHLPAGVTYWQKHTFRLYHHNPPLVKLVAALPVVWAGVVTEPLYATASWRLAEPSPPTFSHYFAYFNADRYFELFQLARLMMPLFSVIGGIVVFVWSRRLYGVWGGLLSLALWVFCPNVLAHTRLITSDMGATVMGVTATYVFWRYLQNPSWRWALAAGAALGVAQLAKFSLLLLFAVWPFLWLVRLLIVEPRSKWLSAIPKSVLHGLLIVALAIVTIDAGYLFEGVGIPLGKFEFASRSLTGPVPPGTERPTSRNKLFAITWPFRINRFRGTWLGAVPCPLPEHYVLGFDEQKIETEGIPERFIATLNQANAAENSGGMAAARRVFTDAQRVPESSSEESTGYPVYLNGELRRHGWWYYYLAALAYKVPEGTWLLVVFSLAVSIKTVRSRDQIADEVVLWTVPLVILFSMSFLTDINLGLRYVLPIAPYVFIATGKVAPFVVAMAGIKRTILASVAAGSLCLSIAASALIYPNFLAYFNWVSGGPDHVPARLIDSNLDWGQDLIGLQKWWKETIPDQPIGLAYFGQINPSLFELRGEPFRWFLAPARQGIVERISPADPALRGPAPRLEPGYYAVSVSLLNGLPFRLYDPAPLREFPQAISPAWNAQAPNAFSYFESFQPIKRIGHSINVYRLSAEDVAKVKL